MKKIVSVLLIILVGIVGYYCYSNYTGQEFYTQITTDGEPSISRDDTGKEITYYEYKLVAYDKKGLEKKVTFNGVANRPLRKDAYLKLKYNVKKGVLSWEEVQKGDIPKKAAEKLN